MTVEQLDKDLLQRIVRALNITSIEHFKGNGIDPYVNADHCKVYLADLGRIIEEFGLPGEQEIKRASQVMEINFHDSLLITNQLLNNWRITVEKLQYLEKIHTEQDIVTLDDNWKSQIQSYLSHIRDAVRKANIEEGIRERIFQKVDELSREVEKNRTTLSKYSELWLETTRVAGEGTNNLRPVVELIRKVAGSVQNAQEKAKEVRQLPPPDLDELPEQETDDE